MSRSNINKKKLNSYNKINKTYKLNWKKNMKKKT